MVHPRLRGELKSLINDDLETGGSSPLTRGTHIANCRDLVLERFIPAYAGNSLTVVASLILDTVHPRLRGEL